MSNHANRCIEVPEIRWAFRRRSTNLSVMNRASLFAILVLLFAIPRPDRIAAQSKSPSGELPGVWALHFDGIGPVKVGMSLSQLNAALQEKFRMPKARDQQGCFTVSSGHHPHVSFMVEDGRVSRIDIDGRGVPTDKGIQVGDSEKQVLEIYGAAVKVKPHAYTAEGGGHYLTVHSGELGLRFETGNGKVGSFYAGRFTSVQYIEGCS